MDLDLFDDLQFMKIHKDFQKFYLEALKQKLNCKTKTEEKTAEE